MTWEKPTMIYVGDSQLQFSCSLTRHGFISICIGYGDLDVSDLSAWARSLLASTLALWVTFNILPLMATLLRYYLGGPHYHDWRRDSIKKYMKRSDQIFSAKILTMSALRMLCLSSPFLPCLYYWEDFSSLPLITLRATSITSFYPFPLSFSC